MRRVAAALVVCLVVVAIAVWMRRAPAIPVGSDPPESAAVPQSTGQPPSTAGESRPAPARTVRTPDSPLPAPVAVEGNIHEQAAALADRVARGGEDGVVAMVTAIDRAGFSIRHADGSITAPTTVAQGIAFNAWEVNAMAELVATRRTIAAPIGSVSDALASAMPGLTGDAMRGYIVDAVSDTLFAPDGPLTFWAAFVVEMGRRSRAHPQYDLTGAFDPATAHFDTIQLAFITRRLAGELGAFEQPERVKQQAAARGWMDWLVTPVAAQGSPCQFTEEATEILDWAAFGSNTAFGGLLGWLEGQGVAGARTLGKVTGLANVLLAYLKLVLTQKAFQIEFEVENAPMVRTQSVRPQQGERRTVVTTVSLKFGDESWINCFRIMLNAAGLDMNLDNDGPFKGAEVTWTGWAGFRSPWAIGAGPEHLVQFIGDENNRIQGSGPTSRSHASQNQVTDAQGKARVEIVGMGQEEFLGSQPREVMKEASLSAMVVLQPANLIKDMRSAAGMSGAGISLLALPAELLFRTRWTFGGNYTFAVKDWTAGNGWTGTVSYREIDQYRMRERRERICCGGRTQYFESQHERSATRDGAWELPEHTGTERMTADFSVGTGRLTMAAAEKTHRRSHNTGWASCRGGSHPPTSTTNEHQTDASASYSGPAEISVSLSDNGEFVIGAGGPETEAMGEITIVNRMGRNDGCNGDRPPRVDTNTRAWRGGSVHASISGTADPDSPTLEGTKTIVQKSKDGRSIKTRVYQWSLRR